MKSLWHSYTEGMSRTTKSLLIAALLVWLSMGVGAGCMIFDYEWESMRGLVFAMGWILVPLFFGLFLISNELDMHNMKWKPVLRFVAGCYLTVQILCFGSAYALGVEGNKDFGVGDDTVQSASIGIWGDREYRKTDSPPLWNPNLYGGCPAFAMGMYHSMANTRTLIFGYKDIAQKILFPGTLMSALLYGLLLMGIGSIPNHKRSVCPKQP